MEKKQKVIQVYGIIVCIVSIITIIICISVLVSAIISRSDPLNEIHSDKDLSSFESYKVEVMKSIKKDQVYIPDDPTIMKMYEAERNEKINRVMHRAKSDILVTSLLIVICIVLFFTHWRMIKKYSTAE
jgi:hypothetical protein